MAIELMDLIDLTQIQSVKRKRSFISYLGHENDLLTVVDQFEAKLNLAPKAKIVLHYLITASSKYINHSVANTVLFEEITNLYKIPTASLRAYLADFTNKNILKSIRCLYNGTDDHSITVYQFSTAEELAISASSTKINTTRNTNDKNSRESVSNLLTKYKFSQEDVDIHDNLFPTGWFYHESLVPAEFLAIAPKTAIGKQSEKRVFTHKSGNDVVAKYEIHATASTQIATQFAYQVLNAIINLAIVFNAKMLRTKKYEKAFQEISVPIKMTHIVSILGVTDSGPMRKSIIRAILELRHTIYNKSDLLGRKQQDDSTLFNTKDFQYIVGLETNSTVAPQYDRNGDLNTKPSLFIIDLNKVIIKELSNRELLFGIPSKIAVGSPLTFLFYLTLRRQRVEKESLLIEFVKDKMFYMGSAAQLQRELLKDLDKYYKFSETTSVINDSDFQYNLCGYHLRFGANPNGEPLVYVVVDLEEMIKMSGAKYDESKGGFNAPTLNNPIFGKHETVKSTIENSKIKVFTNELKRDVIISSTRRSTIYKKFAIDGGEYLLTAYDSNEHLEKLSSIMSQFIGVEEDIAMGTLLKLQKELKMVSYGSYVVDKELFFALKDYIAINYNTKLTVQELLDHVKTYRLSNIKKWCEGNFEYISAQIYSDILDDDPSILSESQPF
ncbi:MULTISPECIES: replication initiator protein RctB domain-containing protein [Vibrio]|uniref:replication initiator protein RctB domain-containing protein n=1 Tax=Vibrio TaxID=662 RepID=UPI00078D6B03|nr:MULTISPECIES: replication initiator protein RctB domain-containing protein [Vibrio]BAU70967.1 hypothetical protein [Vibrio sp. 04Ya108]BBM67775.1 hypothetical protein VA249_44210 [Vibrio alfacsensis]BCN26946.1 hypothetical protein VYA_41380 [Vibrio alfacsensis]